VQLLRKQLLINIKKDPKSGNPDVMLETYKGKVKATEMDLWATPQNPGFESQITSGECQ